MIFEIGDGAGAGTDHDGGGGDNEEGGKRMRGVEGDSDCDLGAGRFSNGSASEEVGEGGEGI